MRVSHTCLAVVLVCLMARCSAVSDNANPNADKGQWTAMNALCTHLCVQTNGPCPRECQESYLGSWSKSKRSGGLEGLTFDDYLFMRWLGDGGKGAGFGRRR